MLKSLSIRNVVLIDKLDLEFSPELNVLSGETGAGKSVLLDSLGLLLGRRADTGLIRAGTDKLSVSGVFELKDKENPFYRLCIDNDLELEQEDIIVKRSLDCDGKSKIFINDQPVTQRFLKEAGGYLVEVHGQFDSQGLLNSAMHLQVLDRYGVDSDSLGLLQTQYRSFRNIQEELEKAQTTFHEAEREEENLRHWVDELQKADVRPDEEESLNKQHALLLQAEKITENLNTAYNALQGRDIGSLLQKAQNAVDRVNQLTDDRFAAIAQALESALIQFDEAVNRLEQASQELALDTQSADQVEERLFALKALARKHQVSISDLPDVLAQMRRKLCALDQGSDEIVRLQKELRKARENYLQTADKVHLLRLEAAKRLDQNVTNELPALKMERAVFCTQIGDLPENQWSERGHDAVTFTVSTNPNSPQGPLNKIASGGELSRLMLALKVNLVQAGGAETLIFDEIDAGIGGATAEAVGERLSRLSQSEQVLIVTHSPQVAAFGTRHFKVGKTTVDNVTTTYVHSLTEEEKQEEIARMLSGERITPEARAAAAALIKTQRFSTRHN
jgi:DNA repair protein RecN (Recombination protein N)